MSKRTPLQEALRTFGRSAGLERRGGHWYRRTEEVGAVIAPTKSQYGPQYYLEQGFWFMELQPETYVAPWDCYISTRVDSMLPQCRRQLAGLLDLETETPPDERVAQLATILLERLLPVWESARTVADVCRLRDGPLKRAIVHRPVDVLCAERVAAKALPDDGAPAPSKD